MTGFSDPILTGDGSLIRKAAKSPNYATGTTGWSINADGSAEFNALTVRGQIVVQSSTQGIFVYSGTPANGNLTATITNAPGTDPYGNNYRGGITSYKTVNSRISINNGTVLFEDLSFAITPALIPVPDATNPGNPMLIIRGPSNYPLSPALYPEIDMRGESLDGTVGPSITLTGYNDSGAEVATPTKVNGNLQAAGILSAASMVVGKATITPVAGTPTSLAVTFPTPLKGTNFFATVTANTTAPGNVVTGVSFTALSANGITLWVNRTNTVATDINYHVFGV